jgi:hypothetical protein
VKTICLVASFLLTECLSAHAAEFTDIPGDGIITCGPNASFQPLCPGGVGTASFSSGALTGALQERASTLGVDLGQTAAFLTFAVIPANPNNPPDYNPQWLGPLGLNPRFQPSGSNVGSVGLPPNLPPSMAYFDATVPLAGQQIGLNVRNNTATTLNGISFFLGRDVNSLSTATGRQNDGLTFGLYCSGQTHAEGTPNDCALFANWKLLITPSGPGTLSAADLDPSSATFGDLLRFNDVDIAPGQTGQFTFFLTDYSSTRTPPGGVFTPANQSFVLEVAPSFEPVPEPGNSLLVSMGLVAILGSTWSVKWLNRMSQTRSLTRFDPRHKQRLSLRTIERAQPDE